MELLLTEMLLPVLKTLKLGTAEALARVHLLPLDVGPSLVLVIPTCIWETEAGR